jgi:mannosyltransferase OCH1-like enzyme
MNIFIIQFGKTQDPPKATVINERAAKSLGYTYKYTEMDKIHYAQIDYKTAHIYAIHNLIHSQPLDVLIYLSEESFIDDPLLLLDYTNQLIKSEKHGLFYKGTSSYVKTDFFILKVNDTVKRIYKTIAYSAMEYQEYVNKPPYDAYYVSSYVKMYRDMFLTLASDIKSPCNKDEERLNMLLQNTEKTPARPLESEPEFHVNITIPKILFQTAATPQQDYVIRMIKRFLTPEWDYKYFSDTDILEFFKANPLEDFPDISAKFHSFKKGAHKADLFRYYYLFINGGVFLDSDAMIYTNIEKVVKNYGFFSVNSSCHPGSIFQGIIGSCQKNPIIYRALWHIYNINPDILDADYHYIVKALFRIVNSTNLDINFKFYRELRDDANGDKILDDENNIIFKHYWQKKSIPKDTTVIPKNFIQTSKSRQPPHVLKQIKAQLSPGWTYTHFLDEDIVEFFRNNPHTDFPNITARFYEIHNGAHRADLFRYYYLLINGGVFLDSDAMIYENIESIIKDNSFVSVSSYTIGTIFQGFLCATTNNPIIRAALQHAYTIDVNLMDRDYLILLKELYFIIHKNRYEFKIKLLKELTDAHKVKEDKHSTHALILDESNAIVAKHFWKTKTVPQ